MAFPLNVNIASAVRTPVGRGIKGALRHTRPDDLAAIVIREAIRRVKGLEDSEIDDVILGCAMPEAEQGLNVARNAVFLAKLPHTVCGETVNRFCSSGLQAIVHAAQAIQTGTANVVVAGGVESMSMVPMTGNKVSLNPELSANYPEAYISMGHTAERLAKKFEVTRRAQDEFALLSHTRALTAAKAGRFSEELVPVNARHFEAGSQKALEFLADECPRAETTLEALAALRPAFSKEGTVTAGNSSPISDGAAATVLVSDEVTGRLGIKPLGKLRHFAVAGVPPDLMGIGPVPAIEKLLAETGLEIEHIDLFEINEAFAAQALYCRRRLEIPSDKLNVNGGAIALGHPLGCTGAKLTATLLHELHRRRGRLGIVSMCIGGGMGAAALFERA